MHLGKRPVESALIRFCRFDSARVRCVARQLIVAALAAVMLVAWSAIPAAAQEMMPPGASGWTAWAPRAESAPARDVTQTSTGYALNIYGNQVPNVYRGMEGPDPRPAGRPLLPLQGARRPARHRLTPRVGHHRPAVARIVRRRSDARLRVGLQGADRQQPALRSSHPGSHRHHRRGRRSGAAVVGGRTGLVRRPESHACDRAGGAPGPGGGGAFPPVGLRQRPRVRAESGAVCRAGGRDVSPRRHGPRRAAECHRRTGDLRQ